MPPVSDVEPSLPAPPERSRAQRCCRDRSHGGRARVELLRGRRTTTSVRHACPPGQPGGYGYRRIGGNLIRVGDHRQRGVPSDAVCRSAQRDGGQQGCRVELRHDVPGRYADARHVEPEHVAGGRRGRQPRHDQARQRCGRPEFLRRLRSDRRPDRRLPADVDAGHLGAARCVSVGGARPRHPFGSASPASVRSLVWISTGWCPPMRPQWSERSPR